MQSEEKTILQRVVENFIRTGNASDEQVKVTSLPKGKTSYVERIGVDGRSVMLKEYRVDGAVVYAGYSSRSATVYLSLV
jgi:benzoyl-CoA reductase/2-hydroxyglutaryl-CoA dehydratase subunit BcrC/BadD/HgdB